MTLPYLLSRNYKSLLILLLSLFVTGIDLKAQSSKTIYSVPFNRSSTMSVGSDDVYLLHWNEERTMLTLAYYSKGMNSAQVVEEYDFEMESRSNGVQMARINDTLYLFRNRAIDSSMIIDIVYEGRKYGQIGERDLVECQVHPGKNSIYYFARRAGSSTFYAYDFNLNTRRKTILLKFPRRFLNSRNVSDTLVYKNGDRLMACSGKPGDTLLLSTNVSSFEVKGSRVYYTRHSGDYKYRLGTCNLKGRAVMIKDRIIARGSAIVIINNKLTFWEGSGQDQDVYLIDEKEFTAKKLARSRASYASCQFVGDNLFIVNDNVNGYAIYDYQKSTSYQLDRRLTFKGTEYNSYPSTNTYQYRYQPCLYYKLINWDAAPGDSQYYFKICPWDTNYTPAFKGRALDTAGTSWHIWPIYFLGEDVLYEFREDTRSILRVKTSLKSSIKPINQAEFNVYPNPTSSFVRLQLSDQRGPEKVKVYNSMGHELQGVYHSTTRTIDLGNAVPGWYLVRLSTHSETFSRIIIRQ